MKSATVECLNLLIECGLPVDQLDNAGCTPIQRVRKSPELVVALVKHGAQLSQCEDVELFKSAKEQLIQYEIEKRCWVMKCHEKRKLMPLGPLIEMIGYM